MNKFCYVAGCLLLVGCDLIQPKVTVKVPANTSYEPLMAWVMAESMDKELTPTPSPGPKPTPNGTLKEGDDCPKCEGGWRFGDGSVKTRCISCNGDGVCNPGDPILLPQEVSVVVEKFSKDAQSYVENRIDDLEASIDALSVIVAAIKSCECEKPTKPVGYEEKLILEQPKKEWHYIFKDNDYYFWYPEEKAFKNKAGHTVVILSNLDIDNSDSVTICHGNHCLNHTIYTMIEGEQGSGPRINSKLQNGTSPK